MIMIKTYLGILKALPIAITLKLRLIIRRKWTQSDVWIVLRLYNGNMAVMGNQILYLPIVSLADDVYVGFSTKNT